MTVLRGHSPNRDPERRPGRRVPPLRPGQRRALDRATADLQRRRDAEIVRACVETVPPALRGGITVWGIIGDADSWIPRFGEHDDWPLLFDAGLAPKPALQGFAEGLGPALDRGPDGAVRARLRIKPLQ